MTNSNRKTTDRVQASRSRGCWLWFFLVVVGLPVCLILAVVMLLFAREQSARAKVRERLDAIAKQGMPIDSASLDSYYKGITDPRDSIAWVKLLEKFESPSFNQSTKGVAAFDSSGELYVAAPGKEWPSEAATRKFLQQWDSLLQELQNLALLQLEPNAKPIQFPIKWNGFQTLLMHVQNMRGAARLLDVSGRTAMRDADSNGVRSSIEAIVGCGHALSGEPTLVGQLVRAAVDGIALGLIRSAIEKDALNEKDLIRILDLVKRHNDVSEGMKIALAGERAMAIPVFSNPREVGNEFAYLPTRSRDLLNYLDFSNEMIDLNTDDLNLFATQAEAIQMRIDAKASASWMEQFDSILTMQTIPATGAVANAFVRTCIQNRLATIAIAVRIHQKRNGGKFPAGLDELASLNVNVEQLRPTGTKPFGDRVEENSRAILWGPENRSGIQSKLSTPDSPPVPNLELGENDPVLMWVWTLEN